MSDDAETTGQNPEKVDHLGLLYRREKLETRHGVRFTPYQPADGDPAPRYPIRWTASWRDPQGAGHEAGPMAMPALIPHLEDALGPAPTGRQ
jgi:hypothetical protein